MIVEFYEYEDGSNPIDPWLDSLTVKMQVKVYRSIELLEQFGRLLGMPDSRPLGDGIFELRIIQGNDITRVLYFFTGDKAILTNGFTKKAGQNSQK